MIQEAIILAGGFGTRLQSVVSDLPKPMAPINGRPFLAILIDKIAGQGISHVVLSVGYKWEMIRDYFGTSYHGVAISYAVEDTPLGTGGATALALEQIEGDRVFLLNGDTYFDVDLQALAYHHEEHDADITLALKTVYDQDRYGTVSYVAPLITAFAEKQYVTEGLINGGVYCFGTDLLHRLDLGGAFSLEEELLVPMASSLRMAGLIQHTYFIDIGIPSDYEQAQTDEELV